MPNVLISSETGSDWRTILGRPQLLECTSICVLSLAHGSELRGSHVYLHIMEKKKNSGKVFFKIQSSYVPLNGL